jgi:hypothetical protein
MYIVGFLEITYVYLKTMILQAKKQWTVPQFQQHTYICRYSCGVNFYENFMCLERPILYVQEFASHFSSGVLPAEPIFQIPKWFSLLGEQQIAQSFKHNQTWHGQQVCRPGLSWATNLLPSSEFQCDQLSAVHKRKRRRLVADNPVTLLLWAGRQVCHPGLSWATNFSPISCRIRTKRLG